MDHTYNPEGKKLTYQQHLKKLKDHENLTSKKKKTSESGRCPTCKQAAFTLRCMDRKLIRKCKKCGHEKVFD
jgi:hypothetical protein